MTAALETLPHEVLNQVFIYLPKDQEALQDFVLVSPVWKNYFEKPLYYSVTLTSFAQLSKLLWTLKSNSYLGDLVQKITFDFALDYEETTENANISTLFTHLTKLKSVDFSKGLGVKYVLEALEANKLLYLKRIELPIKEEDRADYTACVLILKSRLEILSIKDISANVITEDGLVLDENGGIMTITEDTIRGFSEGSALFRSVFEALDDFRNVNDLQLDLRTDNEVALLEGVTKACPLLEKLEVTCCPSPRANSTGPAIVIEDLVPAHNVHHLSLRNKSSLNYPLFTSYIISKFPALESFVTHADHSYVTHWNQSEFAALFEYISGIREVSLKGIPLERSNVSTLRSLWEAKKSPSFPMAFAFSYAEYEREHMDKLEIVIDEKHIYSNIQYRQLAVDLGHSQIIEEYSQYITSLRFQYFPDPLPEEFNIVDLYILQPLRKCPKLKHLVLSSCELAGFDESDMQGIVRKEKFSTLVIQFSHFESRAALWSLNKLFSFVECLRIEHCSYGDRDRDATFLDYHLTEIDIGSFSFRTSPYFNRRPDLMLLVKLTTENSQNYFMYDADAEDFILKAINQTDFDELRKNSENFMFDLRFKSLKTLSVNHIRRDMKTVELSP